MREKSFPRLEMLLPVPHSLDNKRQHQNYNTWHSDGTQERMLFLFVGSGEAKPLQVVGQWPGKCKHMYIRILIHKHIHSTCTSIH